MDVGRVDTTSLTIRHVEFDRSQPIVRAQHIGTDERIVTDRSEETDELSLKQKPPEDTWDGESESEGDVGADEEVDSSLEDESDAPPEGEYRGLDVMV